VSPFVATTTGQIELREHGIAFGGALHRNTTTPVLYEHAVLRGEARIAEGGPFVVDTGVHTGRSPKDKFAVREPESEDRSWWGPVNAELSLEHVDGLHAKPAAYLGGLDTLYLVDAFAGADPEHRIALRVVTSMPYHALFSATMFILPTAHELEEFQPEALVLHAPAFEADP